ncbi:aldehyde dehydrogenase family protein [Ancylomarina euxinus]|uniref:aldehyde dehydrogenase (NAD(+)) n=1 Tax=Ancylomarina euxinus TaxID=2283627 RepID=A0A425Y8G7_9BACT|nr:aldehyde dehydrogenase family protein [Ancylomarina euxinus]MCZ4693424.1 aldehyde dehydrogenase family protein [Ancylomarina euxinus]MUP13651.1 aldehyde dehydrogenase family protein [Ancylomarina euxinus]RRG24707.1 aldehyde dehydrogenase family protein [Ancylomarina euxinus]
MTDFGIKESLKRLGISEINSGVTTGTQWFDCKGNTTSSYSPIDNSEIAKVINADINDYETVLNTAQDAFKIWRKIPAPARGEVVRQIGNALRENKEDLGKLVSFEMGKIYQEGLGEVQEMIDICDFAVGLSRQLYGFTMHSERPDHKMMDQYHPLGVVGVISAFNFPVAVWAWNAMIAAVCGDVVIWKPSSKVPLCALACQNIIQKVLKDNDVPEGVFNLVVAKSSVMGDNFIEDKRVPLISVTGSTAIGKRVAEKVGARLGRTIAELGGNNAIIVAPTADLNIAIPGIVFGSVGTAGQRCTSTRRLIIHEDIYDDVKNRLLSAYAQVEKKIGNPLNPDTLVGPVIDKDAVEVYETAIAEVKKAGGKIVFGDKVLEGNYVLPTFCEVENHWQIVQDESFVPVLYIMKYKTLDEAIDMHNNVPQGLSSSIFTMNMREAQTFLSTVGSDCGIANVNIGTSGAEIGGAFGGEKETGGGRESGSDSWKTYMRRQTNTINYGTDLPLAQGIKFDL